LQLGKEERSFSQRVRQRSPSRWGDGEFDGGFAGGATDESGGGEEPEAQGVDRDFVAPAEVTLEEDREVLGQRGQTQCRFRGPEPIQAETLRGEFVLQFPDHVLAVGAAIVEAPDFQRRRGQIGDQHLELVAG
jgi:hypothetical protein